jgi:ribosomal protein S12 methylthiotransferase
LVERADGAQWIGRSRAQAPEIDGVVRLVGEAAPGQIVEAQITGAEIYDLHARVIASAVDTAPTGA